MIYYKPSNITYTQMCIYIDNNIYADYDEELVFKYLYLLTVMLASKNNYFYNSKDYDDFGIFCASSLFMRITDKRQFEYDDAKQDYKLPRIKSILNYIHTVIYGYMSDFIKSDFHRNCVTAKIGTSDTYSFNNTIINETNSIVLTDFKFTLNSICDTCKNFLNTIPYKKNKKLWDNIYISVMLTFLNNITLSNTQKARMDHLKETSRYTENKMITMLNDNRDSVILFHLSREFHDYILVLYRQLRRLIAKDLTEIIHSPVHQDFLLEEYIPEHTL